LQWLVVNIPGNDVQKGEHWYKYIAPAPSSAFKKEKVAIGVFKQAAKIEDDDVAGAGAAGVGRYDWNLSKFTHKHSMEGPIALIIFTAEYEETSDGVRPTLFVKA